ncbi:MAG: hypothetical protein CVV41_02750 [Candidatus Riflebacteria bacterium HGW-Riflebacteria-1]|jgi:hypothetical protein|nr:MAG: hypothetical protein CVV41_02750 [Candidatus Riflebacteria bacterium HGW-Riflebacteria-1]
MTDRRQSRLAALFVLMLLAVAGTLSPLYARVRPIVSPDDIESIRFLSANNIPVKVLAVYSPEFGNLQFVVALIDIIANMHEKGLVKKEDAFKLHLIPTRASRSSNFKQLHAMVAADRLKKYVEFSSLETESDVWMQDWGEVGVVKLKSEAKAQLVVFDSNRGRGTGDLPSRLAHFWNGFVMKNPSKAGSCGDYGGNIEVTPDNVLLIGNTSTPELRAYLEKHGYANRMAVLETDWLQVGHVDEYISVCPNAKAPRGYTLIKANPRLALRLIKDASPAELNAIKQEDYRLMLIKVRNYLREAERKRGRHVPADDETAAPQPEEFSNAVIDYLTKDETGAFVLPPLNLALGIRPSSPGDKEVEDFIKLNLTLANVIDTNVKAACNKISQVRKESGKAHSVISFPSLFHKMRNGKHIAYIPGSVNQLILHDQLIVPDPQVERLRQNIARTASMIGLKANFVDSMSYHSKQGQIHCGTNVFRHPNRYIVRPR